MVKWTKQIVFTQATNHMNSYLRDKSRVADEMPDDNDYRLAQPSSPRHDAHANEVKRASKECIDSLPNQRQRLAFMLFYMDSLNHQQIAERLNTTVTNVSTMISRAKLAVKACLQGKGHAL
jgi:RNA polymerase sigma factor (sigma-70 family)